jgi:hypothetical protein
MFTIRPIEVQATFVSFLYGVVIEPSHACCQLVPWNHALCKATWERFIYLSRRCESRMKLALQNSRSMMKQTSSRRCWNQSSSSMVECNINLVKNGEKYFPQERRNWSHEQPQQVTLFHTKDIKQKSPQLPRKIPERKRYKKSIYN